MDFPYPVRDQDCSTGVCYNNSGLDIPTTGCQVLNGPQALALSRSRYFQYYDERRVELRPHLGHRPDRAPEPDHLGRPGQGQVDLQPAPAQHPAVLGGPRLQQGQRPVGQRPVLAGRAVPRLLRLRPAGLHAADRRCRPPRRPATSKWSSPTAAAAMIAQFLGSAARPDRHAPARRLRQSARPSDPDHHDHRGRRRRPPRRRRQSPATALLTATVAPRTTTTAPACVVDPSLRSRVPADRRSAPARRPPPPTAALIRGARPRWPPDREAGPGSPKEPAGRAARPTPPPAGSGPGRRPDRRRPIRTPRPPRPRRRPGASRTDGRTVSASSTEACSRNEKMPPPPLSATTTVSGGCWPSARTRADTSWRKARSPTSATVGPVDASATPSAVDTTPSIPLAPRLAITRGGRRRGAANASRSRTGIEDDTTRVAGPGSSANSRWASDGSVSGRAASDPPTAPSAARSPPVRPPRRHTTTRSSVAPDRTRSRSLPTRRA